MKQVLRSLKSLACPCNVGRVPRPGVVLRSLKPLAFPFIRSEPPPLQRPRPKSSFVRASLDPTACPQPGASADRPAEAKPALSATCLPCADSQAGRGLLTRSGNAAFRRQLPQTTHARRGLLTAPTPDPTPARFDVAQVAKSGGVDACLLHSPQWPCAAPRSEKFDNPLSLNEVAEPSPINRLAGTPKLKPGTARLPPNRDFAFDYLAPFAVPPQLPQASAPKRLSADSRPQLFPTSAFFILPSAFAFCLHSPAILTQAARSA